MALTKERPQTHNLAKDFNPEFMKRAIELSRKAAIIEKSGGVFGAVIVKDGKIIAEGYNQVVKQKDPTWHAEIQAIREACKKLGNFHLDGCILYASSECCPMCLAAAYWAKIAHGFYGSTVQDAGKYGNFQDEGIFQDLHKDPEQRRIVFQEKMRPEAVAVWKEYASLPHKEHY